jgi:AmiR/NasT family two-component response regulator
MSVLGQRLDGRVSELDQLMALVDVLKDRNRQLEEALSSRVVIEQAKGVLAERHGLEVDDAFDLLRRAARSNRMRIHDLAAHTVSSRRTPTEIARLL